MRSGKIPDEKWEDELAALLINDTQDAGLLCTAFDLGIITGSSVSVDSDTLENLAPEDIGELLYALNEVDTIREIIPYQASDFLANKLHFSNYSVATLNYAPNATTFEIPVKTPVNSITITYSGATAPVVSYQKAGANHNVVPEDVSAGVKRYVINDGSTYTDIVLGDMITVTCDGNMTGIALAFDTNALIGMDKARLDTYTASTDTHKGAISNFIAMIDKLHNGTSYIDIGADPTAIATLFNTPGNLTALSNYAKNGDSIYTKVYNAANEEAATGVFTGGDVVLSNLLKFQQGTITVNLARYFPNYDDADIRSVYKDLHTIFVGADQNHLTEAEIADVTEWLDANIMDVASLYAVYENAKTLGGMTVVSSNIDSAHAASGKSIPEYITLSAGHSWNTFEAKLKSGFGRVFYEDMKAYADSNHRFNSGNNLSATGYRPGAGDYADFIDLMKESLIPLMSNIKMTGISNKAQSAAILDNLSGLSTEVYSDVIVTFYEGSLIDCLILRDGAHFAMQPTTNPTPWGASGYLKNASTILAA